MKEHIDKTLASSAQILFALKTLKAHGTSNTMLQTVFRSVALAKLQYASPAWHGFASAEDRDRIEAFIRRSARAGYCGQQAPIFKDLCEESDRRLFQRIASNGNHVLHSIMPDKVVQKYNLRPRDHNYALPKRSSALCDRNFLIRVLYSKYQ